jgi:predicted AAA+ superfamily ATPase
MLVRLIRQDGYVTLDRATVRAGAGADPDGFVAGLPVPVALDEVQWVPDLLLAVKAEIDEHRDLGRFLLTGSANVLMLPKVADALPGQMEIVELWPLSQGEIDNRPESFVDAVFEPVLPAVVVTRVARGELFDRVLGGGFPESLQRPVDRRSDWFESYLTAVVEREVRDLSNCGQRGRVDGDDPAYRRSRRVAVQPR